MHEPPEFSTETRSHKLKVVIVLILACLVLSYLVAKGGHAMHGGAKAPHLTRLMQ